VLFRRTFLSSVLFVPPILAACSEAGGVEAQPRTYNARGRITEIRRERSSITIHHEAIEGLMPEMTMPFTVEDEALFEGLSVGNDVDFTLTREEGGRYVIRSIRRR